LSPHSSLLTHFMRIGILGGTFNPIHLAHLRIAEEVRETCALGQVLFIPAAMPPHKELAGNTPFAQRLAMVEVAIAGNPGFVATDLEARRGGKSYSVNTLEILHQQSPGHDYFFIIGMDSFREITLWKDYQRLFELTNLVVAARPGFAGDDPLDLLPVAIRDRFCYDSGAKNLRHRSGNAILFVEETQLAISSSGIRGLHAQGRSIRYLVPEAVYAYILDTGLYRGQERS
jgi:nicotinate-nucleotide adenylyltransferase